MRKKMAAAVLMAAMTASLLAGCGDSKSSDSTKGRFCADNSIEPK